MDRTAKEPRPIRGVYAWSSVATLIAACGHAGEPQSRSADPARQAPPELAVADAAPGEPERSDFATAPSDLPDAAPDADDSATRAESEQPPPPEVSAEKTARCQRAADCAIEVLYDCCGSCPSSPVKAISAATDRESKAHYARMCAAIDMDCRGPRCPPLPRACRFDAVCRKGWCEVAASAGCSR